MRNEVSNPNNSFPILTEQLDRHIRKRISEDDFVTNLLYMHLKNFTEQVQANWEHLDRSILNINESPDTNKFQVLQQEKRAPPSNGTKQKADFSQPILQQKTASPSEPDLDSANQLSYQTANNLNQQQQQNKLNTAEPSSNSRPSSALKVAQFAVHTNGEQIATVQTPTNSEQKHSQQNGFSNQIALEQNKERINLENQINHAEAVNGTAQNNHKKSIEIPSPDQQEKVAPQAQVFQPPVKETNPILAQINEAAAVKSPNHKQNNSAFTAQKVIQEQPVQKLLVKSNSMATQNGDQGAAAQEDATQKARILNVSQSHANLNGQTKLPEGKSQQVQVREEIQNVPAIFQQQHAVPIQIPIQAQQPPQEDENISHYQRPKPVNASGEDESQLLNEYPSNEPFSTPQQPVFGANQNPAQANLPKQQQYQQQQQRQHQQGHLLQENEAQVGNSTVVGAGGYSLTIDKMNKDNNKTGEQQRHQGLLDESKKDGIEVVNEQQQLEQLLTESGYSHRNGALGDRNISNRKSRYYFMLRLLDHEIKADIFLSEEGAVIGSSGDSDIVFSDKQFCDLSLLHAAISFNDSDRKFYLQDTRSAAGTYIRIVPDPDDPKLRAEFDSKDLAKIGHLQVLAKVGTMVQIGEELITILSVQSIDNGAKVIAEVQTVHCFNKGREVKKFQIIMEPNSKEYLGRSVQPIYKSSKEMSSKHMYFIQLPRTDLPIIKDNGSTNGTWLRLSGKREQSQPVELPDACYIRFGFNHKFLCKKLSREEWVAAQNLQANLTGSGSRFEDAIACDQCKQQQNRVAHRILPCNHIVCQQCKIQVMATSYNNQSGIRNCPICNQIMKCMHPQYVAANY